MTDRADLPARLRAEAEFWRTAQGRSEVNVELQHGTGALMAEAADRIEALEAALKPFADIAADYLADTVNFDRRSIIAGRITPRRGETETPPIVIFADFERALRALTPESPQ